MFQGKRSPYSLFYFSYLVVFLGCILLQIESWPFSDFGVYKNYTHPSDTEIYRLAIISDTKSPRWLFSKKEAVYNKFLHDPLIFMSESERLKWMKSFLGLAKKRAQPEDTHLVLMKQTLQQDQEIYVPKSEIYLSVPLQ